MYTKKMNKIGVCLLILLSVGVLMVGTAVGDNGLSDTFQYGTDAWNISESHSWIVSTFTGYPSGETYNIGLKNSADWAGGWGFVTNTYPIASDYWSWRDTICGDTCGHSHWINNKASVRFYDYDMNSLGSYYFGDYSESYNNNLFEIYIQGGHAILYIDGEYEADLGECGGTPSYIQFYAYNSADYWAEVPLDDITTEEGIVGICHENTPNHYITEINDVEIDVSWHAKTLPSADFEENPYYLKVQRAGWDEWYNITELKAIGASSPCVGSVEYDYSELFQEDHYGLYFFQLWQGSESTKIGEDWIFFDDMTDASVVDIEEDQYAIGDTITVNYTIDTSDFGENDYYIYFYDSSGERVDEIELTDASGSVEFTSTVLWDSGTAWAVLVEDDTPSVDMDPPTDINELAFDVTYMQNYIYIHGTCYDASNPDNLVTGTPLANVSVNFTHNENYYTNVSDSEGYYAFEDEFGNEEEFYQDVPIYVHANKTGYTFTDYNMTIIKAGTYEIDLYFVPDAQTEGTDLYNSSIAGLVLDDVFYQAIAGATVHIANATWNNVTTTNTWGYYLFNTSELGTTLGNQSFSMYAEKATYDTTSVDTVYAYNMTFLLDDCDTLDYNGEILDECDNLTANGTWQTETGNTLSINTTDYVESNGSISCEGNKTILFQKQFTPALDTNVTDTGYFYFYSYITDKANIDSDNVTVIISSSGNNASDKITWGLDVDTFTDDWNITLLVLAEGVETGTCNLSAINFTEISATMTDNITFHLDYLRFIEYVGWYSNLNLSLDTGDKQEGTGSIQADGELWGPWWWWWYYPDVETEEWYVARNFATPFDASSLTLTNELMRLEYWYKQHGSLNRSIVLTSDSDATGNYSYWSDVEGTYDTWVLMRIWGDDGYENGTLDFSSLDWLFFFGERNALWNMSDNYDYLTLRQVGRTYHNFEMSAFYDLTVYCKDYETHNTIINFTTVLDETNVESTTNGTLVYHNITYGIYKLEAASAGYYTASEYVFIGADTEETLYLVALETGGGGVGQYYPPPHLVEFKVQNIWGSPYSNVNVTITSTETTMTSWDWLLTVFGYGEDPASIIENSSMSGTTDSFGGVSFLMVETVKYEVTAVNATQGINETMWIYPKDEYYVIIVGGITEWFDDGTEEMLNLTIDVTYTLIDDTHANITVTYNDTSGNTEELWLYLNTTDNYTDQICLSSYNTSDNSSVVHNFSVSPYQGRSYYIVVKAQHPSFGTKVWTFAHKFKGLLIDLGLPVFIYPYLSFVILIFVGGLFGASSAAQGSFIVTFGGWVMYGIGWFTTIADVTIIACLSLATIVCILIVMHEKSRMTGVQ